MRPAFLIATLPSRFAGLRCLFSTRFWLNPSWRAVYDIYEATCWLAQQGWTQSSAKPFVACWWLQTWSAMRRYAQWTKKKNIELQPLLPAPKCGFLLYLCCCVIAFVWFECPSATKSINVVEPEIRISFLDSEIHRPSKQALVVMHETNYHPLCLYFFDYSTTWIHHNLPYLTTTVYAWHVHAYQISSKFEAFYVCVYI